MPSPAASQAYTTSDWRWFLLDIEAQLDHHMRPDANEIEVYEVERRDYEGRRRRRSENAAVASAVPNQASSSLSSAAAATPADVDGGSVGPLEAVRSFFRSLGGNTNNNNNSSSSARSKSTPDSVVTSSAFSPRYPHHPLHRDLSEEDVLQQPRELEVTTPTTQSGVHGQHSINGIVRRAPSADDVLKTLAARGNTIAAPPAHIGEGYQGETVATRSFMPSEPRTTRRSSCDDVRDDIELPALPTSRRYHLK